jgi:hypothetical protein
MPHQALMPPSVPDVQGLQVMGAGNISVGPQRLVSEAQS